MSTEPTGLGTETAKTPKVLGQPLEKLPDDLYIPPDALQVFLDTFEGPLDLLLYLIRRQNLNILDVPLLKVTRQYMSYIELMRELRLELAAEYLVMAAMLAEIKSRLLLPRPALEEIEHDPRMDLLRRLQEYERFKTAGENLDRLPRLGREIHRAQARPERVSAAPQLPVPPLRELLEAFREAFQRAELFAHHSVAREPLSVRERMTRILGRVGHGMPVPFADLVDPAEGRMGVVVCLLAVLELVKGWRVELAQGAPFTPLTVRLARAQEPGTAHGALPNGTQEKEN
ncbi:MAG: segregation/condensation protein A [Nevskiales bacterium]|nr:segregation/condensation protein A [Nevskiales bacterium]